MRKSVNPYEISDFIWHESQRMMKVRQNLSTQMCLYTNKGRGVQRTLLFGFLLPYKQQTLQTTTIYDTVRRAVPPKLNA